VNQAGKIRVSSLWRVNTPQFVAGKPIPPRRYRGDLNIFLAAPLPSCMDSISAEHVTTVILYTVKKVSDFLVPTGMSLTKLSLVGNNQFIPGQGEFG
jgi:hypothetical protein